MEEIKFTRYRISDGREFEHKEEAIAAEQKLFEESVKDIKESGGLFRRLYQSHTNRLLDYIIDYYQCPTVFEHLVNGSGCFYHAAYIWQLKTKEQANRTVEALRNHGIVPPCTLQRIIDQKVVSEYLGRTMVLQISTTPPLSVLSTDAYRIVDGIDKAFLKFHDDAVALQALLYPPHQTSTQGDSEK